MNNYKRRLQKRIKNATTIDAEKVVYMSDMHLGTLSIADETMMTKHLIFYALKSYFERGFYLVLLGDTFELAENPNIEKIKNAHDDIMWMFSEFYKEGRLTIVRGNHEEFLRNQDLYTRESRYDGKRIDFLPNIKIAKAVKDKNILAIHGHEYYPHFSSFLNKIIVSLGCFWKWWQLSHHDFHTSESTGWQEAEDCDLALNAFAIENDLHIISGHTHKCSFSLYKYKNCGSSGVMPRCITCVEHDSNCIKTVKFAEEAQQDGTIKIVRSVLGEN